jgi:hypothetical protein
MKNSQYVAKVAPVESRSPVVLLQIVDHLRQESEQGILIGRC